MPGVVRLGDVNTAGGAATQAATTVHVNSRGVVFPGASVSPHPCCGSPGCQIHCSAVTTTGSQTVFSEGKPVIFQGNPDSCTHARYTASPNVYVGP